MATNTPNLGMRKPTKGDGGDADDFVNVVADVNTNMDLIDQNINLRLATSGNRPSAPYPGSFILETDTGNIRIWNSVTSNWDWVASDNTPWGRQARTTSTTDGASLTSVSAETLYISATWTAQSDRRYWVEIGCHVQAVVLAGAVAQGNVKVRYTAGAAVTTAGTQVGADLVVSMVNGAGTTNAERVYSMYELPLGLSGQHTVGLFLAYFSTAGDTIGFDGATDKINHINVRDVGVI